jgi:hypothetical protein
MFLFLLKHNDKLIFGTWKQKLVTMAVAVTVGGVTTMAVMAPHLHSKNYIT